MRDRVLVILGSVCTLMACATSAPPGPPAPVAGQTVQTWIRSLPEDSGKVVFMRNDGTRPIVIATLTLTNCVNTLQVCDVYHPNVAIAPGETVIVLRIQPLHPGRVYKFEFEYQWHT